MNKTRFTSKAKSETLRRGKVEPALLELCFKMMNNPAFSNSVFPVAASPMIRPQTSR